MAANRPEPARLLSIQSHVVCGYVGNRSATFPLQLLGWETDVINTVQFSNHTGFGRWGGSRFDEHHLDDIFRGLDENGLLRYSRVLTGYIPSPQALRSVQRALRRIRELNPDVLYVLDPVMGDIGRGMYVNPEVLPIYKEILSLASIITPNQFEAQVLADQEITSLETLKQVLTTLHVKHGVRHVLITSVELPDEDLRKLGLHRELAEGVPGMTLIGSTWEAAEAEGQEQQQAVRPWVIQFPEVQGYFSGVGDLFAALLIGRYKRPVEAQSVSSTPARAESPLPGAPARPAAASRQISASALLDAQASAPTPLSRATELAVASVQAVLATTSAHIADAPRVPTREEWEAAQHPDGVKGSEEERAKAWAQQEKVELFRRRELKVVQSRDGIEQPLVRYRARWLD